MRFPACDNWKPVKQQRGPAARSSVAAFKPLKPRKPRRLWIGAALAGLLAGVPLIKLLDFSPLLAALLTGAVVLLLVSMDSYRAWTLLVIASLFSGYRYSISSFSLTPEIVAVFILAGGWALSLLAGKMKLHRVPLILLLAAYLILNLFTAVLHSPTFSRSFESVTLMGIYISMYVITVSILQEHSEKLKKAVKFFLIAGTVPGVWGILSLIGLHAGVNLGTLNPVRFVSTGSLGGRMNAGFPEADVMGSFEAMMALLFFALLSTQGNMGIQKKYMVAGAAIASTATVLTLTRGAWVGLFLGIATLLLIQRRKEISLNRKIIKVVSLAVVIFAVFSLPVMKDLTGDVSGSVGERFSKIFNFTEGSGLFRKNVYQNAVQLAWQEQPLLGRGVGSLVKASELRAPEGKSWINSSLVESFHDAGIVGLLLYVSIQTGILLLIIKGYRKTTDPFYRASLAGFISAFISMITASQASSLLWTGIPWVFSGLAVSVALTASKAAVVDAADK